MTPAITPALLTRFDKKCGKSGIAPGKKCSKATAAVVATGAGLLTAGFFLSRRGKRPSVIPRSSRSPKAAGAGAPAGQSPGRTSPDFSKSEFRNRFKSFTTNPYTPTTLKGDPNDYLPAMEHPGMHDGHVVRKLNAVEKMAAIENRQYVDTMRKFVPKSPESDKAIQLLQKLQLRIDPQLLTKAAFVPGVDTKTQNDIFNLRMTMNQKPTIEGFYLNYSDSWPNLGKGPKNAIFVSFRRESKGSTWKPLTQEVGPTMDKFFQFRNNNDMSDGVAYLQANIKDPQKAFEYVATFQTYSMFKGDTRDAVIALHESAHAIDNYITAWSPTIRNRRTGATVSPSDPVFIEQAKRVVSGYGGSDADGARSELFAEAFTLYTLAPQQLRKNAPYVYHWVNAKVERALTTQNTTWI